MVKERAYGKINLGLDVLRRRPDGYHELKMIMQTVDIYDDLTFRKRKEPGIALRIEGADLSAGTDNLICRAAALLLQEKKITEGVEITLKKRIPIAAGMAGGSADAAAALRGVNTLLGLGCSTEELQELGVKLGADIPYCLVGGTMLSEGIGEILTPLTPPPACHLVVAKPPIDVSTAFVYGHLQADKLSYHPDIDGMAQALAVGDLKGVTDRMGNVLETVTEREYPVIGGLKELMREMGAENALMSGSGPTVFGICKEKEQASQIAAAIEEKRLAGAVFVTTCCEGYTQTGGTP
ncbi:MAG: 4-(cytidine 5'-diphospho)-2-C-methyl-D-erythritol kinase [Lachnospiraceae bacterium]|nr:4-(cytidine 5'-diphospho)-2-C-methyl-D-erythritol kinase [Lachnospiraceae bacterium]